MADGWLARGGRLIRSHAVIFAVVVIWAFAPLVAAIVHVASHGGVMTGVYGSDFFDQFQYLAWIRDEGSHLLASNLWQIAPSPHDYLQPMYLISGALWRAGLGIQVAYLIWLPVAVLVLFLGCAAYVRRMLRTHWQQAAALVLALFYHSPVYAIGVWTGNLSPAHRFELLRTTTDADAALQLWGFAHAAIAIGVMPIFLLTAERLLTASPRGQSRRLIVTCAMAGAAASWLHPWQGLTLLVILAGLFAVAPPRRRFLMLTVPIVATALPLVYTEILAHTDSSWQAFQSQLAANTLAPAWALVAAFFALVVVAACGVRRPRADGEWMLLLWPVVGVLVYVLGPNTSPHALAGIVVPLAVLAVRGWERVRTRLGIGLAAAATVAVAAIGVFTVPAAIREIQDARATMANTLSGQVSLGLLRLTEDQASAVNYLDRHPRAGGVLAPWFLSMSVPGFTGRQVFAGHQWWGPHANLVADQAFFNPLVRGRSGTALRRAIFQHSQATFVLADCDAPPSLGRDIAPLAQPVRRFGCVTVYERG